MIPDEPARGRIPPPWFRALSGVERIRTFSRGLVPIPPMARLLGYRTTHVASGTATVVVPECDAGIGANGQFTIVPATIVALESASITALPEGADIVPLRFTLNGFRPSWPAKGNLVARARVVNDSSMFVFAEAQVEDPDGRYLGQASLHSLIQTVEPAPPSPPATMKRIEEPVYETPDPYLRRFACSPLADLLEREDGLSVVRQIVDRRLDVPSAVTFDLQLREVAEGRLVGSIPASEWFCGWGTEVSYQAIATLADMGAWLVAMTLQRAGTTVVMVDSSARFLAPAPPDGRRIAVEAVANEVAADRFVVEATIRDGAGRVVALATSALHRFDASRRIARQRKEAQRVLTTLLFTDIVDSTGHAQRLGDAAWRALLEQHNVATRREVSRYNGTEVSTTGDGFLARFDSPAQAIEAASSVRRAVGALDLQIRGGVHSGECEVVGSALTGMAVHIASRIQATAAPGEILVSSTVKALVVGSAHQFIDRGEHVLKGVPEPWRLYAVTQ